jgi:excisionase family DNA binding protein
MENLLSVKDVMEILQVSRTTAYGLIGSGRIRVKRIGRLVRISSQDLARFVEGRPDGKPKSKRRIK